MSNFNAPTRLKGSNDEFKDAVWIDNYFGHRHYGVRFRGTAKILDADLCEVKEEHGQR